MAHACCSPQQPFVCRVTSDSTCCTASGIYRQMRPILQSRSKKQRVGQQSSGSTTCIMPHRYRAWPGNCQSQCQVLDPEH